MMNRASLLKMAGLVLVGLAFAGCKPVEGPVAVLTAVSSGADFQAAPADQISDQPVDPTRAMFVLSDGRPSDRRR